MMGSWILFSTYARSLPANEPASPLPALVCHVFWHGQASSTFGSASSPTRRSWGLWIWCMLVACTAAFGSEDSAFRAGAAGIVGACALGAGSLLASYVADRLAGHETFGAGDVKLLFVVGLFSGAFWGVVVLVLSCAFLLAAAFIRLSLGAFRRRRSPRRGGCTQAVIHGGPSGDGTFPFAPFVAVAVCTVLGALSCAEGAAPMA